jgi:hypothetical protein
LGGAPVGAARMIDVDAWEFESEDEGMVDRKHVATAKKMQKMKKTR